VYSGPQALEELATHPLCDLVVVAVVGAAGLRPTLAALRAGKRVALANKEALVIGGHLVMEYREQIVPLDSEHSALWQLFTGRNPEDVAQIILTASGGPLGITQVIWPRSRRPRPWIIPTGKWEARSVLIRQP